MPKRKIGVQMNRTPIIIAVAIFVALASVAPTFAASTTIRSELKSAYRLLRQDDEYGARKILWSVRATLVENNVVTTLKTVERVIVLIQRQDYVAARVRLKSICR